MMTTSAINESWRKPEQAHGHFRRHRASAVDDIVKLLACHPDRFRRFSDAQPKLFKIRRDGVRRVHSHGGLFQS